MRYDLRMPESVQSAIEPAENGRSWAKACCLGCVLFVIAGAIALFLAVRFLAGPGAQPIAQLPSNYPADLPLFRLPEANGMTFQEGKNKGRIIEFISLPVKWFSHFSSSTQFEQGIKNYANVVAGMDRVTVTWTELNATQDEALAYYVNLFKSAGMSDEAIRDDATHSVGALAKRPGAIIQLLLTDTPEVPGVDRIVVTVDYVPK